MSAARALPRRLLALTLVLLLGFPATLSRAQSAPATVTFLASGITQGGGSTLVADGSQMCFLTTDNSDRPAGYRVGTQGQTTNNTGNPDCYAITSGAISPTQIINSNASYPMNACIRVTILDPTGSEIRRNKCVQTGTPLSIANGWCSGSAAVTCDFAKYPPNLGTAVVQQYGPAGTIALGPTATVPAGTPASVTNSGTASNAILGFSLPEGRVGPQGPPSAGNGQKGDKGDPGTLALNSGVVGFGSGIYSVPANNINNLVSLGDSLTAYGYPQRIASDIGADSVTNRALGGSMVADVASQQVYNNDNPQDTGNPTVTVMAGTNEALQCRTGAYEAVYHAVHQGVLAWEAIPQSSKVFGVSFTRDANWAGDTTYTPANLTIGIASSTNGATATTAIKTYGGPLYIWQRLIDGSGGTFTVSIDGGTPVAYTSAASTTIATTGAGGGSPVTQTIGLIRIPVSAGYHGVKIVVTSATGSGNLVGIHAIGTAPLAYKLGGPRVYSAGVPLPSSAIASSAGPACVTTTAPVYNADALADVALLRGDGVTGAVPVDVEKYYNPDGSDPGNNTAALRDVVHPTDAIGTPLLALAFESAMQPAPRIATSRHRETNVMGDYTLAPGDETLNVTSSNGYGSSTVYLPYRASYGGGQKVTITNGNGGASAVVRLAPSNNARIGGADVAADGNVYLFYGETATVYFDDGGFSYRVLEHLRNRIPVVVEGQNFQTTPFTTTYLTLGGLTATLSCTAQGDTLNTLVPDGNYYIRALNAPVTVGVAAGCTMSGSSPTTVPIGSTVMYTKLGTQWF